MPVPSAKTLSCKLPSILAFSRTRALLGGRSGASKRKKKAAGAVGRHLPLLVAPKQLDPFISQELREGPLRPVEYVEGDGY